MAGLDAFKQVDFHFFEKRAAFGQFVAEERGIGVVGIDCFAATNPAAEAHNDDIGAGVTGLLGILSANVGLAEGERAGASNCGFQKGAAWEKKVAHNGGLKRILELARDGYRFLCVDWLALNDMFIGVADARLNIVFEDERLLVLNKPAGLVCHPTKGDEYSSLVGRVRIHMGPEYHLINRLDRETSGLVLIAKEDAVAKALRRAWETGTVQKTYQAIVHGWPAADRGRIGAALGRDVNSYVAIKDCVREDGLASETSYQVTRKFQRGGCDFALLEVKPHSGRKHQIRIHLGHIGHPIVGDKIYGGDEMLYIDFIADRLTDAQREKLILPHHALHAQRIEFPLNQETMSFEAPPEEWFVEFLR